jgi:hypothetical protein
LKNDPTTRAYIIVYGGRVGPKGEAKTRAHCTKDYLIKNHRIEPERIVTVDGGYREEIEVELYILFPGDASPNAVSTISASAVKVVKKRKIKRGGCE